MNTTAIVLVTACLFGWGLVSRRMARADLTAPIVFIVVGALLAWSGLVEAPEESAALTPLVEVTLVWVLFSDAARLPVRDLRQDVGRYARLLGVGLPLTVVVGWALAAWFWPGLGLWLALLVGAALAPTDAALGVPVVTNPVVRSRIRQLITVESGLNDGIATPVVMVAIAGAAAAAGLEGQEGVGSAVVQLVLGVLVGCGVGAVGGWLLRLARRREMAAEDFVGIAVLALALLSYAAALVLDGNGFVAAFCGGIAFGACAGRRAPQELVFVEQMGGARLGPGLAGVRGRRRPDHARPGRSVDGPVRGAQPHPRPHGAGRLAMLGSGPVVARSSSWEVGPRGLASLVFALLALEALGPVADEAVAVVTVTVLLSVLAHGLSAAPLARRYGAAEAAAGPEPGGQVDVLVLRPGAAARRGAD